MSSGSGLRPACVRVSLATIVSSGLMLLSSMPGQADNGPMQMTSEGISPGVPNGPVRMVAENVAISVGRRARRRLHEIVLATFNMFNRGPTMTVTTGFPGFNFYLVPGGLLRIYLRRHDRLPGHQRFDHTFRPTTRAVKLSSQDASQFGDRWLVWDMPYPSGQTTSVKVSYDQMIQTTQAGFAYVGYVLHTGALWNGTIADSARHVPPAEAAGSSRRALPRPAGALPALWER